MLQMPKMELITSLIGLLRTLRAVICRFICKSAATAQTRASYIQQIIEKYGKEYMLFCLALKNRNDKLLDVIRQTPFYIELVVLLPSKIKRQFEDSLDNREWDKAMDLLRKIASGEWD
jgi:hypothetical protein